MDPLQILKYITVIIFIVFSLFPIQVEKNLFIGLDILTIMVLFGILMKIKNKSKIPPVIAIIFLILAHLLNNVKCGMCVGLGVGVILAYLN